MLKKLCAVLIVITIINMFSLPMVEAVSVEETTDNYGNSLVWLN